MNRLIHFDPLDGPPDPDIENFPRVPDDLLEALERMYPNCLPSLRVDERELWASIGRQQVIAFLREMRDRPRG